MTKCRALRATPFRIYTLAGEKSDKSWHGVPDLSGKRGTECPTCRESVARSARLVGKAWHGVPDLSGKRKREPGIRKERGPPVGSALLRAYGCRYSRLSSRARSITSRRRPTPSLR